MARKNSPSPVAQNRAAHIPETSESFGGADDDQLNMSALLANQSFVDDVPARPGMTQMWARYLLENADDIRNMSRLRRLGWTVRPASSVGDELAVSITKHGTLGDVISVGDLILMEIPTARNKAIKQSYQDRVDAQMQAIKPDRDSDLAGRVVNSSRSTVSSGPSFQHD